MLESVDAEGDTVSLSFKKFWAPTQYAKVTTYGKFIYTNAWCLKFVSFFIFMNFFWFFSTSSSCDYFASLSIMQQEVSMLM